MTLSQRGARTTVAARLPKLDYLPAFPVRMPNLDMHRFA